MSQPYFCADLHLGHRRIAQYRTQFKDSAEHDEFVLDMVSSITQNKRRTLYILGDVAFTLEALDKLAKLNAHKNIRIILGNHDTDREVKIKDWVNAGFEFIHSLVKYKNFWLSHAPIHESELRGKFNVYGHSHFAVIDDPRYRCVSLEQINYKPISLDSLREEFSCLQKFKNPE